ncbi:MAG: hypothetical protein ACJ72L_15955 [Marmoricola sp.]
MSAPLPVGPRRRLAAVAVLLAAASLALGCSSSYHAGDQAAREWDSWVKDHPLAGAHVTDTAGTNVQPFHGTFEAYARLTAEPSEPHIVKAMASMCRFDSETGAATTYWLQVDRISVQAPCRHDEQQKVARFWTAVHELPGIEQLAFSTQGLNVTAHDDSITHLVPELSDAAAATGREAARSTSSYTSEHVRITQPLGEDLGTELPLAQAVLDTVGDGVKAIEVVPGRVSASTSGTVAQAQAWQQDVGHSSPVLTVTPDKVTTEVGLRSAGRELVDRLSRQKRVLAIEVVKPFWTIQVRTTDDARDLVRILADEIGAEELGQLQLDVGPSDYDSATGKGRTCFVRPAFPESRGRAAALLDLCDVPNAVEVDDRFDAALDLRLHGTDLDHAALPQALACLHRMPSDQPVYLQLPQNDTIEFSTGPKLVPRFPQSALAQKLSTIWDGLH